MSTGRAKFFHEFRDPVHAFIRLHSDERRILDCAPVQRLRNIQQLALTNQVYPGANHTRFEHSLGVLHVATQIFDVVTKRENVRQVAPYLSEVEDEKNLETARKTVRMAALLHDVGHYPFSHAAEEGTKLFPPGWKHEAMSFAAIRAEPLKSLLTNMGLDADRVARVALGQKDAEKVGKLLKLPQELIRLSRWERVLSQMITGDFGADRIDYLLRDSLHAGVAYGNFDQHRLIDCLRALAPGAESGLDTTPALGTVYSGLQAVESLILARYFMFTQVYYHPIRQAYDYHLQCFLEEWLNGKSLPTTLEEHLKLTDIEVLSELRRRKNPSANRILDRKHFKVVAALRPGPDGAPDYSRRLYKELLQVSGFGEANVYLKRNATKGVGRFPVLGRNQTDVVSSQGLSTLLDTPPSSGIHYLFVSPERLEQAEAWYAGKVRRRKGKASK